MKKILISLFLGLSLSSLVVSVQAQTKWDIDMSHSSVNFAVDHMGITETTGKFKKFAGSFTSPDDNFSTLSGTVTIQVGSIDTDDEGRDKHLKGEDFFDAAKFSTITFTAKSAKKSGKNITVSGDLTMKGVTKPVTLTGEFKGVGKDLYGNTKAGFLRLSTTINRKDFGVTWNKTLDAGGLAIGEEVRIVINTELTKK